MSAFQALPRLAEEGCSAILRTRDQDLAGKAMEAAVAGGFRVVEFTLTTPGALDLVASFAGRPDLVVGAGTVLGPEQARAAVEAGAAFLVSPVLDPAMVALGRELGVLFLPGTSTPTEMWQAHLAGAEVVKLFPAAEKGPGYLAACLGPMPWLRIFPTSGVTEENLLDWLEAGAFGVGLVGPLFDPRDLREGAFGRIQERARRIVGRVKAWRAGRGGTPAPADRSSLFPGRPGSAGSRTPDTPVPEAP